MVCISDVSPKKTHAVSHFSMTESEENGLPAKARDCIWKALGTGTSMQAGKCSWIEQDTHGIYSSHSFLVSSLKNQKSSTPLEDSGIYQVPAFLSLFCSLDLIPFLKDWQRPQRKTQSSFFARNTHHFVHSQQWPYANTYINSKYFWLSITFFTEVHERAPSYQLKTVPATHVIHLEESTLKIFL